MLAYSCFVLWKAMNSIFMVDPVTKDQTESETLSLDACQKKRNNPRRNSLSLDACRSKLEPNAYKRIYTMNANVF